MIYTVDTVTWNLQYREGKDSAGQRINSATRSDYGIFHIHYTKIIDACFKNDLHSSTSGPYNCVIGADGVNDFIMCGGWIIDCRLWPRLSTNKSRCWLGDLESYQAWEEHWKSFRLALDFNILVRAENRQSSQRRGDINQDASQSIQKWSKGFNW